MYNLIYESIRKWSLIIITIALYSHNCLSEIPSKIKLCGDDECKQPISKGVTLVAYPQRPGQLLEFRSGEDVDIFGLTDDDKYYDIIFNGNRGYVPKNLIRESIGYNRDALVKVNVHTDPKVQSESLDGNRLIVNDPNVHTESKTQLNENESNKSINDPKDLGENDTNDDVTVESVPSEIEIIKENVASVNDTLNNTINDVKINTSEGTDSIENVPLKSSHRERDMNDENTQNQRPNEAFDKEIHINENLLQESQENAQNVQNNKSTERNDTNTIGSLNLSQSDTINTVNEPLREENNMKTVEMTNENITEEKTIENPTVNTNETHEKANITLKSNQTNHSKDVSGEIKSNETLSNTLDMNKTEENVNINDNTVVSNVLKSTENDENNTLKDEEKRVNNEVKDESLVLFDVPVSSQTQEKPINDDLTNDTPNVLKAPESNENVSVDPIIKEIEDVKIDGFGSEEINEENNVSEGGIELEENSQENITDEKSLYSVLPDSSENVTSNDTNINDMRNENMKEENVHINEQLENDMKTEETNEIRDLPSVEDSQKENEVNYIMEQNLSQNVNDATELSHANESDKITISNNENISVNYQNNNTKPHINESSDGESTMATLSKIFFFKEYTELFKLYLETIGGIIPDDVKLILNHYHISQHLLVFSSIIAFNWCLMKLLITAFCSSKRESELRDITCKAQRKLFYIEAEQKLLQSDLEKEKEKAESAEQKLQVAERKLFPLEINLNKIKNERDQFHQKMLSLESDLESSNELNAELNKLVTDFLTSQRENVNLNESVEVLQKQITKQEENVTKYEKIARQKERENTELKEKYEKTNCEYERLKCILKDTELNLEIVQSNNEELKASKTDFLNKFNQQNDINIKLQQKIEQLISKNDELLDDSERFREELTNNKKEIENKNNEIESFREIIKNFKKNDEIDSDNDNDNDKNQLNILYDVVKLKTELRNVQSENESIVKGKEQFLNEISKLNQRLSIFDDENKKLKNETENAIQEKLKAQMELEVLTKYYKEKEMELGKEIGVQQVKRQQREDDASTMADRLKAMEEENVSYKNQLQLMKNEIMETERRLKTQINNLEKQSYENWITAKAAERKFEEAKVEATVLRQTLTLSAKSPIDGLIGDMNYMDDSASSVSSHNDHFGHLPMPPPPPPLSMMHQYQMGQPYGEENGMIPNMWNSSMGPLPPQPPLSQSGFMPIQMDDNSNIGNYTSPVQPLSLPYMPQMNQWEPHPNRDTFTPSSHQSRGQSSRGESPVNSFQMYSHGNQMQQGLGSLSNPTPPHWVRPNGMSGVNNNNNNNNEHFDATNSRPDSRIKGQSQNLHTSMV